MGDPPSPSLIRPVVIVADEQGEVGVDAQRWEQLARDILCDERAVGELTLTFVDRDEIAALNAEHLSHEGPTDVLAFPIDDDVSVRPDGVPVLLGDVVVCPAVAAEQAPTHAGSLDDELALLVVHGVLHVLGRDHADAGDAAAMRARERELLEAHHWRAPAPAGFCHGHDR